MTVRLLAFTDKGLALAQRLADLLGGEAARCGGAVTLAGWTADAFAGADALVFVGAAGIAVRAIAPHLQSKATDPAVVAVDEAGRFAIPLASGHLGGANRLARRIAAACGGTPVITTATDVNGRFAVDEWARVQGFRLLDVGRIRTVSGKLLAGGTVTVASRWPVAGTPPEGVTLTGAQSAADVSLGLSGADTGALRLIPPIGVLGVGCRRGTPRESLEQALAALLAAGDVCAAAIREVATIDLKQNEPGLAAFCRAHEWPLTVFSAQQLQNAPGAFTSSDFVRRVTGVDNVCERAAVLAAGGKLYLQKQAGNGVTMALALAPFAPDWRWQDE